MRKFLSPKLVSITFGVLVLCFVIGFYVLAWTEPSLLPTGGNIAAPINVGSDSQTKTGSFTVKTLSTTESIGDALIIESGGDLKIKTPDNTGSALLYSDTPGKLILLSELHIIGLVPNNIATFENSENSRVSFFNQWGDLYIDSGAALYSNIIKSVGPGTDLNITTRGTGDIILQDGASGNVGIGTTVPGAYRLNIQGGNLNVSGDYYRNEVQGVTTAATCGAGEFLSSLKTSGGMVTAAGSCVTPGGGTLSCTVKEDSFDWTGTATITCSDGVFVWVMALEANEQFPREKWWDNNYMGVRIDCIGQTSCSVSEEPTGYPGFHWLIGTCCKVQ